MSDVVELIKENCDIVDVVGRYVNLKHSGSIYKGLCPFHSEKTPSFVVYPDKQFFICFGCGKKGDVINFVQQAENLDFMDTIEKLAEQAGIEVNTLPKKIDKQKEELYEVSRQAAIHFYKNLRNGANAGLKYVVSRGISPETAQKFGIGYAKDEWQDLVNYFNEKNISEDSAIETGLLSKNKNNESYDKFRNRVIFPIKNTRDKVIGFGARTIDGSKPKYLNSPESIIFKKKDNLYGLNLAKNSIRKKNCAILVEGYMDVVSLVASGVENVVATLGTALTLEQAKLLKRYTDTVVLAYDSDNAGQAATMRGMDILQQSGLRVKILRLDEGKDPDEYIKKNGREAFENLVEQAISFMEYKINSIKNNYDINTTDGSIRFLEAISVELKKLNSPVEQAAYVKIVAEMSGIPESSILREMETVNSDQKINKKLNNTEQSENIINREANIETWKVPVVKLLIKLMIGNAKYISFIAENDEISNYFYGSGYERILEQIVMNYSDDSEIEMEQIIDNLDNEDVSRIQDIIDNLIPIIDEESTLLECVKTIKIQNLSKRRDEIMKVMEVLEEDSNKEEIDRLSAEIMDIGNVLKRLREGKE